MMSYGYHRQKERNYQKFFAILIILIFAGWMAFSPTGLWPYLKVTKELRGLKQENQRLETENRRLAEEINKLQNDPEYIEKVAREEHGFLKKDEIVIDFRR